MTLTIDRSCRTVGCERLRNRPEHAYCDDCLRAILEPPRRPRDRKPCPECGSLTHVLCAPSELELRWLHGDQ